jgi:hypothetical protein
MTSGRGNPLPLFFAPWLSLKRKYQPESVLRKAGVLYAAFGQRRASHVTKPVHPPLVRLFS